MWVHTCPSALQQLKRSRFTNTKGYFLANNAKDNSSPVPVSAGTKVQRQTMWAFGKLQCHCSTKPPRRQSIPRATFGRWKLWCYLPMARYSTDHRFMYSIMRCVWVWNSPLILSWTPPVTPSKKSDVTCEKMHKPVSERRFLQLYSGLLKPTMMVDVKVSSDMPGIAYINFFLFCPQQFSTVGNMITNCF